MSTSTSAAQVMDGKALARQVRTELRARVERLSERGIVPRLGIVLAGEFPPSLVYVRNKEKACCEVGIAADVIRLVDSSDTADVVRTVIGLNADRRVHGIIVQLPLPASVDSGAALDAVAAGKDVDGLSSLSLGRLLSGRPGFVPATPSGIVRLLAHYQIPTAGRHVVVVGRSALVGKSLANLLLLRGAYGDATVTVCHTRTPDLAARCREADILVAACGSPGLIGAAMVRPGAVVVDAGVTRTDRGLAGDVDFPAVVRVASAITPVPGGVGPMTVAMLLTNVVRAAEADAAAK